MENKIDARVIASHLMHCSGINSNGEQARLKPVEVIVNILENGIMIPLCDEYNSKNKKCMVFVGKTKLDPGPQGGCIYSGKITRENPFLKYLS